MSYTRFRDILGMEIALLRRPLMFADGMDILGSDVTYAATPSRLHR